MTSETQLKALSEEALRDIYVESLDVSCRVQAKGELAESEGKYPLTGKNKELNCEIVFNVPLLGYIINEPDEVFLKGQMKITIDFLNKLKEENKIEESVYTFWLKIAKDYYDGKIDINGFFNEMYIPRFSEAYFLPLANQGLICSRNLQQYSSTKEFSLPKGYNESPEKSLIEANINRYLITLPQDYNITDSLKLDPRTLYLNEGSTPFLYIVGSLFVLGQQGSNFSTALFKNEGKEATLASLDRLNSTIMDIYKNYKLSNDLNQKKLLVINRCLVRTKKMLSLLNQ